VEADQPGAVDQEHELAQQAGVVQHLHPHQPLHQLRIQTLEAA
jgi:hypothetical protein